MRYVVIGTSGAGKSTFARALATRLSVPYIELDALYWGPDWTPHATPEFERAVREAAAGERWVADGNYTVIRDILWSRATHLVWLDFGRRVIFPRVLHRTLRRILAREALWAGNRETLRKSFLSRQSILLWSLTTFRKNRRKFEALRTGPEFPQLVWHRLASPRAADAFLRSLRAG